jgi:chlorobactene glucosyltransferase
MLYLFAGILVYLLFTLGVLLRNHFQFISSGDKSPTQVCLISNEDNELPKVSLLIPARNEERVIRKCVHSALLQTYDNLEILVLDDDSEDTTSDILKLVKDEFDFNNRLRILQGEGPIPGWLGKPRACKQLAESATGQILIFIDADTWLEPSALSDMVDSFVLDKLDAITIWPQQHMHSFWEKVSLPLVYFALTTLLPVEYVKRDPKWLPKVLRPRFRSAFAAACGQCIGFSREAYLGIGGHGSVKNAIVEDVQLAKNLKSNGYRMAMYHGINQIHCRMYEDHQAMFEGFRKNFFAGFGYSYTFFLMAAVLHLSVYILPYFVLAYSIAEGVKALGILAGLSILLIHIQRWLLDKKNKWNPVYGLMHPLGVLWFQWLGLTVLVDRLTGRRIRWKGRSINNK